MIMMRWCNDAMIMIVMMVILMIMMKNCQKNIQKLCFFSKNVPILGTFTWWKKGQQIRAWVTPPHTLHTMPESKRLFSKDPFPNSDAFTPEITPFLAAPDVGSCGVLMRPLLVCLALPYHLYCCSALLCLSLLSAMHPAVFYYSAWSAVCGCKKHGVAAGVSDTTWSVRQPSKAWRL